MSGVGEHAAGDQDRRLQLLDALLEQVPAAIAAIGRDGERVLENSRYRELEARGLDQEAGPAGPAEREVFLGEDVYLSLRFPVFSADGVQERIGDGEVLLDVTQRRLRAVSSALIELEQLKSELVTTVSHELRTPLSSILGYCELLSDGEFGTLEPQAKAMVEVIARNSQRLSGLLKNLLMLAQVDVQVPEGTSWTGVELCELVESVRAHVARQPGSQHLDVVTDTAALDADRLGAMWVQGDRGQLRHALMNLASNAVKFAAPSGTVRFRLAVDGTDAILEVIDDGMGIDPEDLPRLADRFYRTSAARTQHVQGAGVGLSVVASVARRHGGRLELDSQPAQGTTARLRVPLLNGTGQLHPEGRQASDAVTR